MNTNVNILYCISSTLKLCSVQAWKLRLKLAEKDAVLTENLMFSDNPGLFWDRNAIK